MDGYRKNGHAVFDIKYHVIWVTKYRYKALRGPIAIRTRELIRQGCEARGITILQGSVGKDHIHLLLSCPPSLAPSKIIQYLKGRSSRLLQDQFPDLKKKYWGNTCGQGATFVPQLDQWMKKRLEIISQNSLTRKRTTYLGLTIESSQNLVFSSIRTLRRLQS